MAMGAWDWEMRELYRALGDVDAVCREVEARGGGAGRRPRGIKVFAEPVLGINVEVSFRRSSVTLRSSLCRSLSAKRADR